MFWIYVLWGSKISFKVLKVNLSATDKGPSTVIHKDVNGFASCVMIRDELHLQV